MPLEKALALVLRTTDFRETSRVVTLWTRPFGKVRALAKGGRRLRSQFESALDLLNCCDIVLIRKTSEGLDLLTEARLRQRFAHLHLNLEAFYAGCLIAEIVELCAQENEPHPHWFDLTLQTLQQLQPPNVLGTLLSWEIQALREVGLQPMLDRCVLCKKLLEDPHASRPITWSALAGGVVCQRCAASQRTSRSLSPELWLSWRQLTDQPDLKIAGATCRSLLDIVHEYWMHQLARPLRLAAYFSATP